MIMRSPRARLAKYLRYQLVFPSSLRISYWDYFRHRPVPFSLWVHARRAWNRLRHETQTLEGAPSGHLADYVIPYSQKKAGRVFRDRTERLMNVLRSIQGLSPRETRVLVIGPRNEAELLLLSLYGFDLRKTTAIDLVRESPLIRLMDMHKMDFPDNYFALIYSANTLPYSDEVSRACQEMLRVVQEGGLMVVSFLYGRDGTVNAFGQNPLSGGVRELLEHFAGHVEHVYWHEEYQSGESVLCSVVFRVRKGGSLRP
jgi:SAM-dependent methyltransferase